MEREATLADIKRAYKRLARQFHPDINPGDRVAAAQFRQIAEAYETLSDPERRRSTTHRLGPLIAESGPGVRLRGLRLLGERQRRRSADVRRSLRRRAAAARRRPGARHG